MLNLSEFARSGALAAFLLLQVVVPVKAASLIGDEVFAAMSGTLVIDPQFPSSAIVGDGVEFTGGVRNGPCCNLTADIQLDVTDTGFTVTALTTGVGTWGGHSGTSALRIDLFDLDWLGMEGEIVGINDLNLFDGFGVQLLGFGADSAIVIFHTLHFTAPINSHSFSFDFEQVPQVPLPATAWLLLSALGGLGFVGWRRERVAAASSRLYSSKTVMC